MFNKNESKLQSLIKNLPNLKPLSLEDHEKMRESSFGSEYKKTVYNGTVTYEYKWSSSENLKEDEHQVQTDKTFDKMIDNDKSIDQAVAYLKNWRWYKQKIVTLPYPETIPLGLYIYGTHDASKTHLMHGFLNHIKAKGILDGKKYRIYNWSALIKALKDFDGSDFIPGTHANTESTSVAKATEYRCKHEDLIIFDDIGSNVASKYEIETITSIIEHRKDQKLDTFFTSNLSISDLSKSLDKRIAQKILEMATSVNIKSDRRQRHEIQKRFQSEYESYRNH